MKKLAISGLRWLLIALAGISLSGCVRYRHVLVEPAEHRQTIPDKGAIVTQAPLDYQFTKEHERLAVRIMNRSPKPVRLLNEKSYLVDPTGATHPLPGGTVAPNGHIGVLLPPMPLVFRSSPRFTFGVGVGHGYGYHGGYHHLGWGYDQPLYYGPTEFYAVNPPHYWEWRTGEVRLRFVYEAEGTNTFEHNFTLGREKAK